jgi:RNA polymerase sigma factor (sigma-70 family)
MSEFPGENLDQVQDALNFESPALRKADKEINDLIMRCGEGDSLSLKRFFSLYSKEIYNFPIKIFRLDEDSASEYFIYAFERLKDGQKFSSFHGKSSFRSWFYSVLRNLVIDFLRTRKDANLSLYPLGMDEDELTEIEDPVDFRQLGTESMPRDFKLEFQARLKSLELEPRVYVKLSFVYYLDFDHEELTFLSAKSGRSKEDIMIFLANLRAFLAKREENNLNYKDRIVTLFNAILKMKDRRTHLLGKINELYSSSGLNRKRELSDLNSKVLELDRKIEKKYHTRAEILNKSIKGVFMVRTPYKYITLLLKEPKGTVSVRLMHAMESFKNAMSDLVQNYM